MKPNERAAASKQPATTPYDQLMKSGRGPSSERIGQIWTWLYPLIIASFGYATLRTIQGWYPHAVLIPFAANLGLIIVISRIFLQQRRPRQLFGMLLAVIITLVIAIIVIIPYSPVVAVVQLPYLLWVLRLTLLERAIIRRNGTQAPNRI